MKVDQEVAVALSAPSPPPPNLTMWIVLAGIVATVIIVTYGTAKT